MWYPAKKHVPFLSEARSLKKRNRIGHQADCSESGHGLMWQIGGVSWSQIFSPTSEPWDSLVHPGCNGTLCGRCGSEVAFFWLSERYYLAIFIMLQNKGRVNRVSINSVRNFTATDSRYTTGMNTVYVCGITLFFCQPVAVQINDPLRFGQQNILLWISYLYDIII